MPIEAAQRTIEAWTKACNPVSRIALHNGGISNVVRSYGLAYETTKSCGPSAQVAQSCTRHVTSKYAAMRSNGVKPLARVCSGGSR